MGPGWMPNRLLSQPRSNMAWETPSAAPIESRFITAACSGIMNERNTTRSSSADSAITMPMKSGSLLESTCAKSAWLAVAPPT